jgi:serine/threonine-protein kinase HipA
VKVAEVRLWGRTIGAVAQEPEAAHATFQYDPEFAGSGIEVAPLTMPLARRPYTFPQLATAAFHGLPGLLADSLPDLFGNALIDAWLAREGRRASDFGAIDRLCYVGTRGTGALEYRPSIGPAPSASRTIEVDALADLASRILNQREGMHLLLSSGREEHALRELLRVGTSAGGARAKALIAWNPGTNEIRSGQIEAGSGWEHWILKFDGVADPGAHRISDPAGFGRIEYAYALMARAAGITMSDCRLLEENGRAHFMTRRFDRTSGGKKLHMLSLGAMAHLDFNAAGAHGYEQALHTIRTLDIGMDALEDQFRRMVFNVVARNQDDHVKNIAFLMDPNGGWTLSPAFDLSYAHNPAGDWTARHQMTVNGKQDNFSLADLEAVARGAALMRGRAAAIHEEVRDAVSRWPAFAAEGGVEAERVAQIETMLRLELPRG